MKRILAAIFMLVIVIGVSYVSAIRTRERTQSQYQEGKTEGLAASQEARRETDSLSSLLAQERELFADSLSSVRVNYQRQSDSLEEQLAGAEQKIKAAKGKQTITAKGSVRKVDPNQVDPRGVQVLAYYRQRLAQLPKDLSDYERKVALAEVREETSRKFSISLADLESLRKTNRLNE